MGRAPCCEKDGLKKGPWTPEEDQKLIDYIQKNGYGNWRTLPKNAGLQRCGKSCRLRWTNYLRPDIKRGRFSFEEEETIIQLHSVLGNKWSAIAARLPGRTDNEVKNYWNTHIRKRLLRMGIDPVTHSPRLDLLDISSILSSSLCNSSQMNLLGLQQSMVNPELLRLAASLFSSTHRENPNFLLQENQLANSQSQNPLPSLVQPGQDQTLIQEIPSCTTLTTTCTPFSSEAQQFSNNVTIFNPQSCQVNEWENNALLPTKFDNCVTLENNGYYGSDQSVFDPSPSENSNFRSSNYNFMPSWSNFSTPSSSPTLNSNSNSTYINGSCTEDEREISYCSNLFKFEIPEILEDNIFM